MFQIPVAALLGDLLNRFGVSHRVLATDVPIDLITVGIEINIGGPSIDFVAAGHVPVLVGVDTNGDELLVHGLDQARVAKGFLVEHFARWAVVTEKMDQYWALLGPREPKGLIHILNPANLVGRRRIDRERDALRTDGQANHPRDHPENASFSEHTRLAIERWSLRKQ